MSYSEALARLKALKNSETPIPPADKTDRSGGSDYETRLRGTAKTDKSPSVSSDSAVLRDSCKNGESLEERREWSDALCNRLHTAVARETPDGLGRWDPAWQIVEEPSKALLDAMVDFERTGDREAKQRAVRLASEVLASWKRAAAEWHRAGGPDQRTGHELTTA